MMLGKNILITACLLSGAFTSQASDINATTPDDADLQDASPEKSFIEERTNENAESHSVLNMAQDYEQQNSTRKHIQAYVENGKLHFSTGDNKFHWWLDNRIYLDAGGYIPTQSVDDLNSKANKDLASDDSKFRFSNGVILRRARMAIKATLYDKWFAEFDLDYAYNELDVKDMYIGFRFKDNLFIKAGQFKEPMSMMSNTSSKYLQSLERPMPIDAFASGRNLGVSLTAFGNMWWASGGVFGQQVSLLSKERNRGNDGYAVTARAAIFPINNDNMTVHIGGYATRRTPDSNGTENRLVEFRALPESEVDHRRFVDAEVENVNHYYTLGYELGFRYRKFLAYGEYVFTTVNRYQLESNGDKTGLKNCTFNGWFANASYMILGQARRYAADEAEFGPMEVNRKGGNLEIAAHYSTINLNDFHDIRSVIYGGKANAISVSLNWYPKSSIMIGLNYVFMNNDKYADSKGRITSNGKALSEVRPNGIDFSVLQTRFMISF